MHRRIWRAYTALVEQGYTKIATITSHSELDLIIAKATSPDDLPLPERYVWDLAIIFTSSPSSSRTFAISFTRRFGQTRCWRVALKCLLLLHRLLQMLPSDHPFRADILSARANAFVSFYPCHFRDASSSYSEDYTAFIKAYAHLIDEVINCCHHAIAEETHNSPLSYLEKMKEWSQALEVVQELQSLVERAMECVPTGPATRKLIVRAAMKQIARESFMSYVAARKGLTVVLDSILQMPYRSCIEGLGIYKRAADQAIHLGEFYETCKLMGLCGEYEYPTIENIPKIQVKMLEAFVEQMWQLTESSSASSPITSDVEGDTTDDMEKQIVVYYEWENFEDEPEEEKEEKPLIKFGGDETSWEVLLEASIRRPWTNWNLHGHWDSWSSEEEEEGRLRADMDSRSLQLFNPQLFNPFFWS